jgi:hypothetical protein
MLLNLILIPYVSRTADGSMRIRIYNTVSNSHLNMGSVAFYCAEILRPSKQIPNKHYLMWLGSEKIDLADQRSVDIVHRAVPLR